MYKGRVWKKPRLQKMARVLISGETEAIEDEGFEEPKVVTEEVRTPSRRHEKRL